MLMLKYFMNFKNIIFSLILHSLVIYYVIFHISSPITQESQELHIKIEVENQSHGSLIEEGEKKEELKRKIVNKIDDIIKGKKIDKKINIKKDEIKRSKKVEPNKIENNKAAKKKKVKKDEIQEKRILKDGDQTKDKAEVKNKEIESKSVDDKGLEDVWFEKFLDLERKNKEKEYLLAIKSIKTIGLTNREKFNLYSQIKSCFQRAIEEKGQESSQRILVKIKISKHGFITSDISDLEEMIEFKEINKEQFKIAVYNAKRAIEICNPLRGLPKDKFAIWKEVILDFSQTLDNYFE